MNIKEIREELEELQSEVVRLESCADDIQSRADDLRGELKKLEDMNDIDPDEQVPLMSGELPFMQALYADMRAMA